MSAGKVRALVIDAVTNASPETKDIALELGGHIRRRRKAQKLTLKALGERVGTSASALSDIERGYSLPSIPRLIEIANALGTTASFLLTTVRHDEPTWEERVKQAIEQKPLAEAGLAVARYIDFYIKTQNSEQSYREVRAIVHMFWNRCAGGDDVN